MKLASLKAGDRDGTLVVVSRDLSICAAVSHIAHTLQEAIEHWSSVAPNLAEEYDKLNAGKHHHAFKVDVKALAAPLPRAYQFLDGSAWLSHMEKARKARGADMPPNYRTEPLMYQGLSHQFLGARDPLRLLDDDLGVDMEAEIAVVTDEVPMGTTTEEAGNHVKLAMLLNDFTLRALTKTELPKGFGFLQAKPTSGFSPVAVSVDELDGIWDGEKFNARLYSYVNGTEIGHPDAGKDMYFTYPQLIAHAARTRNLCAGTVLAAGTVANVDPDSGCSCLAELRVEEQLEFGEAKTPFLKFGDAVQIDLFDRNGQSIFGRIDQQVLPA